MEEKLVESNDEEVDKEEGHFKKKRIKMMAKSSNKVLGKGNKVDINEIEFVIMEDNNAASEIVETIIVLSLKLWKKRLTEMVMTDIEFEVVKDNNVESGIKTNDNSIESEIVKGKTRENSNVDETTNNNNTEDKSMENDDFDEYLREDIYDEMKKFYNIDYF